MAMLRNYNLGKNINFTIFLKKFMFFFLVFSYLTYNNVSPFCKSLENIYKQDIARSTKFNRLLERHEHLNELDRTRLREELSDRRPYKEERNMSRNISAYSHVKRNESNNIDVYMKNYKHRYGKKKGLSKLYCYYENKVFRKFNHIRDIAEKVQYNEKRAKKFFLRKYGIGFILFALIPALGLIFPMIFGIGDKPGILGLCPGGTGSGSHFEVNGVHKTTGKEGECNRKWLYGIKDTLENFGVACYIFSFIMITIFLLVVFYILIKIIKYEKIKAGKGKMNIKEYSRFCKDIL